MPIANLHQFRLLLVALVLGLALSTQHTALAATFNPSCTGGIGDSAELQAAIATASSNGEVDTINLVPGCVYTITEELQIGADAGNQLTINVSGPKATIAAGGAFRVLNVSSGAKVTITGVIISGGSAANGAGILNSGTLELNVTTVSGNSATAAGGGLYNDGGTVEMYQAVITENSAPNGGGVFNGSTGNPGTMWLIYSEITHNTSSGDGGGVWNQAGTFTMQVSDVDDNQSTSGRGGGIWNDNQNGNMNLNFSHVRRNYAAGGGGGIQFDSGKLLIDDIYFVDNNFGGSNGAVVFSGDPTSSIINSCITNNGAVSVTATTSLSVINTWWGAADGPSGVGTGHGDSVSENVIFTPFLTAPLSSCVYTLPPTTTTLVSDLNPAPVGQTVTFTATVTSDTDTPTGTVTFSIDGTPQAPVALDGAGVATLSTSTLTGGSHTISAAYSGDSTFAPSTSSDLTQVIAADATTTALTSDVNPAFVGETVTFTATVTSDAGTPTGTVTFSIDGTPQAPVALDGAGEATFSTSTLPVGSYTIVAAYSGDLSFASSTSADLTQVIDPNETSTLLTSSANPAFVGQTITFTATVTSGAGTPTGTVTFSIDGTPEPPVALDGSGIATFSTSTLSVGSYTISAVYSGDSDFATSTSDDLIQVIDPLNSTTTTLTSDMNPAFVGQSVTFTATVTSGAGTPTGTITFSVDGTPQTPVTLNGAGEATFSTSTLTAGSHTISATYNGDSTFATSTSSDLTQVVNLNPTTTTLASDMNPAFVGQTVTLTATVTSGAGTPTGTVTFSVDGTPQSPVALVSGVATYTTASLTAGSHTIVATYSGDATFATSTSSDLTQVVNPNPTTTTLTSDTNPAFVGQTITFTATVTSGADTPTGTVTFSVDGTPQSPVALVSGEATFTTASLSTGSHTIVATYSGDSTFATSTSSDLTQVVNLNPTTTTLTSTANPAFVGQSVTFTATVTSGAGTPTGTVTFSIDGTPQTPVTLNGAGVATFSTSTLSTGSHTIVATYSGDATFATSTSADLTQVVNLNPTTTTLTSDTNPAFVGQSVTFTATVTSGAGTPTGTVTFSVDGTPQSPVALNGAGVATFSTSTLSTGSHTIVATYSGDATFATSTSADLTQVVNLNPTTTTLTSDLNPAFVGQTVTFTATVTSGAGTPTGTVTFSVDGAPQSPVALNGAGVATFSTNTLPVGSYTISAVYSGATTFAPSTSSDLTQVIDPLNATTTTLITSANPAYVGQTVTFTATVTPTSGTGTPTGIITFFIDGTPQTPVTLDGAGEASVSTNLLSVGSHSVYTIYDGDTAFAGNISSSLTQVIELNPTTTTLTSDLNPALAGQLVTLTATVTSGAGTPTGTVTFSIDGTPQSPVALNGAGEATYIFVTLTAGSYVGNATYNGDSTFATSTSSDLTQVVNPNPTTTTLTSDLNPAFVGQTVTFTATVTSGAGTPTGTVTFSVDGTPQSPVALVGGEATFSSSSLVVGSHTISAEYTGSVTFAASTSADLTQIINPLNATTTTLTSSANPAFVGQAVTFTATVTSGAGTPTGTVTFSVDGTPQTPVTLNGAGVATFSTSTLTAGSHTIVATYSGDSTFATSTSSDLTQIIDPNATTTTLTSTANPAFVGQPVTFTATVTSGAGTPTGTVTFSIDGTPQLPVPLVGGQATLTTSSLAVGSHTIVVTYSGDSTFATSTSSDLTQVIDPNATTTTLTSSANPAFVGQAVTFTATVTSGAGTPTGTVTFSIDGTPQSPVSLVGSGVATFSTSTLTTGSHTIVATYSGDATFATSTSSDLTQVIDPNATTTTLTSTANPAFVGQTVTFTATVTSGAGTPTGTVTFSIDGNPQSPVALVSGQATLTTNTLTAGSHTIVATYSGDSTFAPSTSSDLTQVIDPNATTTTLTSDANPALSGQTVTVTATVTAGAGTPTGTVTFSIDGMPVSPVPLVGSGVATFTTASLTAGSHTIVATYSGDSTFATSTSSDLTQVIASSSASVLITPTSFITSEGSTVSYQIQLTSAPSVAPVAVSLIFDGTALSVNGSTVPIALTFTDTTPQTVTVDVLPDPLNNTTRVVGIDHAISASSAPEYPVGSVLTSVYIQVQDDLAPVVPTLPPPPASPTCSADNFDENSVVRTGIPDELRYAINCRPLYQYGHPTQWLGNNLYHAGSIGVAGLEDLGIQQAVDIFSPAGVNYFHGGAVFCLKGSGYLIWLAASQSPRHAEIIGSYTVPEFPGFTCATLFEPGTLVLVSQNPIR